MLKELLQTADINRNWFIYKHKGIKETLQVFTPPPPPLPPPLHHPLLPPRPPLPPSPPPPVM